MAHTPGPWERGAFRRMSEAPSISVCEITQVGEFGILAHVYRPDQSRQEGEDNAALIAAAPDMYEALKQAKREMWDMARHQWALSDFKNWAVIQQIDAALAKARAAKAEG